MGPKAQEDPPSAASFGELVEWLSVRGVRPRDSLYHRKAWGKKELAGVVGRSPKQISNWIKNKSLPRPEELPGVERAFFGTDQNYRPELRIALREALQRSRSGRQVAEAENLAGIRSTASSAERGIDRDAVLVEILKHVTGLPLAVARSIVDDFGVEAKEKSPGEIEAILRRKAQEYQALKAQLSQLAVSDPNVKALRDEALQHIDRGQFDLAYQALLSARDIDRSSSGVAQSVMQGRRRSEAETMLTTARLAGIRNRYREAVANLIEVRTLIHGLEPGIEHEAIALAAEYLNSEYRERGDARTARRNIEFFNQVVFPASEGFPEGVRTKIKYELADVYSTFGYRMSDNKIQREAVKQYRLIQPSINASDDADLRLRCHIGLGQLVAELGLNRGSVRQARLGVRLMKNGLDIERDRPSAASRAAALINLGTAQANTALVSKQTVDYEDAVESYNAALRAVDGADEQLLRAQAYWGQAIALTGLGKKRGKLDLFDQAEAACNSALEFIQFGRFPIDWATIIQNRGNARLERGKLENGVESLYGAIEDYELALAVRSKKAFALGFAKTKGNAAIAKRIAAEREGDVGQCREALAEMDDALSAMQGNQNEYWRKFYGAERQLIVEGIGRLVDQASSRDTC